MARQITSLRTVLIAACLTLLVSGIATFSQAVRPPGPAPAHRKDLSGPAAAVTPGGGSAPFARVLTGGWTYRSFVNDPDVNKEFNAIRFGAGILKVESVEDGAFRGTLDFGPEYQVALKGSITYGNPPTLRFQGVGTTPAAKDWVYDYRGYLVLEWPHGVEQRPALVGSIIRTRPHSAGRAPAGVVASWVAVRQDEERAAGPGSAERRKAAIAAAVNGLREDWQKFYVERKEKLRKEAPPPPVRESLLPPPERRSLALATTNSFQDPEEIPSQNGELRATLAVMKAVNRIGGDPVFLRSYNGRLVGPTLRARPGDKLRITVRNDLEPDPDLGDHNTLHHFNTTNLHTHGLHVSPSGISDNVLLTIKPGATQDYEIDIPKDHPAGTFWYHAHRHGSVAAQVSSGMSGALIVEGGLDTVPEIAAARERTLVLQQIPYYNEGLAQGLIELEYVREVFGPGTWDTLKRFTTVNGVQLPVIRLRPGTVERWRLIHSGVRETIKLKLEKVAAGAGEGREYLPLHEIAVDGLALGKMENRDEVELWPGYRSDVLIKAPEKPATYLLIDERKMPQDSVNGLGGPRKHIALMIVEGEPNPMRLPADAALKKFRLKSIRPEEVTGTQEAKYAIKRPDIQFTINDRPYDPARPRVLTLGAVEEWKVWSDPDPAAAIPVPHPFHVHVNPFEIHSMTDESGKETLTEPVWKDTVILRPGWNIKFRTRYEHFTGDFVQHCHILDHEDLGMMELIRIAAPQGGAVPLQRGAGPPHAAAATLQDVQGRNRRLDEYLGRGLILVFSKGLTCPHCVEQMKVFARQEAHLRKRGISLVFVTPDAIQDLQATARATPFVVLSDPRLAAFRQYDCYQDEPLHGVVLLDPSGKVRWRKVGPAPFLDAEAVVREAFKLSPGIEVEIRETGDPRDDYVTWAPTRCRIRLSPDSNNAHDLRVVLTNDPPRPPPPNRALPLDGDLLFSREVLPGKTATEETLTLVLPRDGSWVPFAVTGKPQRASTRDKDAVLEVHQDAADGPVLATHALMVRVRKDIRTLTDGEKGEFLKALHDLHMNRDRYEWFVKMHALASHGDMAVDWPDQAHGSSGFLPWHRAFLLQFERELQKTYPHVALPYWRQHEPPPLFTAEYLGTTRRPDGGLQEQVLFAPDNLLYGWRVQFNSLGYLHRAAKDHSDLSGLLPRRFRAEQELLVPDTYAAFHPALERNPHNLGHLWVGGFNDGDPGWMRDCQKSPADPVFWVFHCEHDHLWAKWQWVYDRFRADGLDPSSYWPTAPYVLNDPDAPLGHHLPDAMWPWDGTAGPQPKFPNDFNATRPRDNTFGPFPAAGAPFLWPGREASPSPADMIDYWGLRPSTLEHGVCYDDVPFGAEPTPRSRLLATMLAERRAQVRQEAAFALDVLTDVQASAVNRLRAADTPGVAAVEGAALRIQRLVRDPASPVPVREKALALLAEARPGLAGEEAIRILSAAESGEALGIAAVGTLSHLMRFGRVEGSRRREFHHALQRVTERETRGSVLAPALAELALMGDPIAARRIKHFLEAPATAPIPLARLVAFYASARPPDRATVLRPFLRSADTDVRMVALLALSGDAPSEADRLRAAKEKTQQRKVRIAAIQSLMHDASGFIDDVLLPILRDAGEDPQVRTEAAAALRVAVVAQQKQLPRSNLEQLLRGVEEIGRGADPDLRRALGTTTEVLRAVVARK